jgi:hypothetical protein
VAYAIVKTADNDGGGASVGSITATFSSNIVAGNCLVVFVYYIDASTRTITMSGAAGGSWSQVGSELFDSGDGAMEVWVCLNATGGATQITATFGANIIFPAIYVVELSGIDTAAGIGSSASPVRLVTPGAGTDAATMTTLTPSGQPAAVVGLCVDIAGAILPAAGTGYTALTGVWDYGGVTAICCRPMHKRITSTANTPVTGTVSNGATANSYVAGVVLLEAAGAPLVLTPSGSEAGVETGTPTAHLEFSALVEIRLLPVSSQGGGGGP